MKTIVPMNQLANESDGRDGPPGRPIPARPAVARHQRHHGNLPGALGLFRKAVWVPATLMLALLGGCLEKHFVWSPDGKCAAVIAKDGLHLCDSDGKLTPLLLSDVDQIAWFSDSQRLAVSRTRKVSDWASIARVLGPERAAAVTADADGIWSKLESGGQWSALTSAFADNNRLTLVKIVLRERHEEALRAKLSPGDWNNVKSEHADFAELMIARIEGDQIRPGILLHEGLEKIEDIRVSPDDRAVAFTTNLAPDSDKEFHLLLARVDAAGATIVAERTAAFPDWTSDSRGLAYIQAAEGAAKDDLRLGTLVRRGVLNDKGMIAIQKDPEELAGSMFSKTARVRCLRDGRIMFSAVEFSLPVATKDVDAEREKLFVLDPARQSTLVRVIPRGEEANMPKNLTFFELSPDEQRVLVGGYEGDVSVLTIATGDVSKLQDPGDYNLMAAPVWRNKNEITYARRNPTAEGKPPARKAEVVLRKIVSEKGAEDKVLSGDWSLDTLESVFSPSDKK